MTFLNANKSRSAQAVLDALSKSQAVIEFNLDGTILFANQNFLNVMGYTLPEIQGKHHKIFVEPGYDTSLEYQNFWKSLRAGNFQAAQYKRLGKNGKEVWIQASYNPVLDKKGNPVKIIKFATDITADVMEKSDFKGQIDAIGKAQAVIHFNLDGTILWANPNFLSVLGYKLEEVIGQHHKIFVEPKYEASNEYKTFWENLRKGEFQTGEYRRLSKSSKDVWIQASYNPIFDPNGRPFKVVKFATDITRQYIKRIESDKIGGAVDENLGKIVGSIKGATDQSTEAASAASEASSTVQTIAAGAEELSSSIREIAESMASSRREVDEAINQTASADSATLKLSHAAEEMGGIVRIIQDIANQINLLALNATIESARAGDAGKGFAVVASEVKKLATEVAQATDKISGEINGMQNISHDVIRSLAGIKGSIQSLQTSVTGVAGAIEEQSAVTTEISSNMQTASEACGRVDNNLRDILVSMGKSTHYANEGQEMYKSLRAL